MNSLNPTTLAAPEAPGLLDKFARSQVLRYASNIPKGCLEIEEAGELHRFGNPDSDASETGRMIIHDQSAYREIAFGGSIGGAEAYMSGKWSTPNLLNLTRLMSANIDFLNRLDDSRPLYQRVADKLIHLMNRNTERRSKRNISRHYDLSNEFFALFLDPEMMYSAAIFPAEEQDLDRAAVFKLETICRKLDLQPDDHLLEIGTGWGGLAIYAAKRFGCRVTTTTISREQYENAVSRVRTEGLENQITVLFEDYRELEGEYDKLVSVEMIEAVGHEYYHQYFKTCAALLKPEGLMLLQAITIPDQRYEYARKSVDFIQRYIFPGGCLPSHEVIMKSIRAYTDMRLVDMHEIGMDYARTLEQWRERFVQKLDQVRALGFDDQFIRMWNYYLCYCQGGFEEHIIGTSQMVFAKPDWRGEAPVRC